MNIFVLSTGRCGSTTFAKACEHIENYSIGHESLSRGADRPANPYSALDYPDAHIEVDNRLAWFLGQLDETFGDEAYYVHLLRDEQEVAQSYASRWDNKGANIVFSFAWGILKHPFDVTRSMSEAQRFAVAQAYVDTVNTNIRSFLRDKSRQLTLWLHEIDHGFATFWEGIRAEGDLQLALSEWNVRHNATNSEEALAWEHRVTLSITEISELVAPNRVLILADEGSWGLRADLDSRTCLPFLEKDGKFWGPPSDSETAINELDRLRNRGAVAFFLAWPAFWYLTYFPAFHYSLRSRFPVIIENDRLIGFDLQNEV